MRQRNNKHFLQIGKCIVFLPLFLQDFANFKTFLRAKNRRKTSKKPAKSPALMKVNLFLI